MNKTMFFLLVGLATVASLCRGDEKLNLAYAPISPVREWKLPDPPPFPGTDAWYDEQVKKIGKDAIEEISENGMTCLREEEADRIAGLLDRHYRRCPLATLERMFALLGYYAKNPKFWNQNYVPGTRREKPKGDEITVFEWRVWRITSDVYFLLTCENGAYCIRDQFYRLVFYDGKTARVADCFAIPPTVKQVASILRARRNPDALNNVAVKLANPDGTLYQFSDNRIGTLLCHAAMGGIRRRVREHGSVGQGEEMARMESGEVAEDG